VVVDEIRNAVRLREAGQAREARERLEALWPTVSRGGDPFAVCFLAHSLADLQDDLREQLRWHLVALEAADEITDERAAEQRVPGGRLGLYSLRLNLAEDYVRLGDDGRAAAHYRAGRDFVPFLGEESYGSGIRDGFDAYAAAHPDHLS